MRRLIIAVALVLGGCASAGAAGGGGGDFDILSGGRVSGPELAKRIEKASHSPLGGKENPVRVNMPAGEYAYLAHLRCSDGKTPQFQRVGNFGFGVYGSIIDGFDVVCASGEPKKSLIFMDMYHGDYRETAAPPGFTLAPN